MAIFYTTNQKIDHLKSWVTSCQPLRDYCREAGVSRGAMSSWAMGILGADYTTTLRNADQKAVLLKKIERMEEAPHIEGEDTSSSNRLVMVKKSKSMKSATSAPISIDYMGAKISIDESTIESVFRALKAVNGLNR